MAFWIKALSEVLYFLRKVAAPKSPRLRGKTEREIYSNNFQHTYAIVIFVYTHTRREILIETESPGTSFMF
jgi:hypothetical protein